MLDSRPTVNEEHKIEIIQIEHITIQKAMSNKDNLEARRMIGKPDRKNIRGIGGGGETKKKKKKGDVFQVNLRIRSPVQSIIHTLAVLPILQMHLVIGQRFSRTRGIQLQFQIEKKKKNINKTHQHTSENRTFPGQSEHFMRHSGALVALTLRKMISNLSLGYLTFIASFALVSHCGG